MTDSSKSGTIDGRRSCLASMSQYGRRIAKSLEEYKFREAIGEAMNMARQKQIPSRARTLKVYKQDAERAGSILYVATQITAVLSIVFEPFYLGLRQLRSMLAIKGPPNWEETDKEIIIAAGTQLDQIKLLFAKIEDAQVEQQRAKLESTIQENKKKTWKIKNTTHKRKTSALTNLWNWICV